ncbi:MAG TPA: diaminopimelate decarboxylase [Candidatus Nanoarchaeia archaeon]|nr:diaminopimelate decarboxylase [Candidatus Nanoarchaeia archaeon]
MIKDNRLYVGGIAASELAKIYGTPLYAYDEAVIRQRCKDLQKSMTYSPLKIYYACKANSNPTIMRVIKEEGCEIDAVSPGEIVLALNCGYAPKEIVFTGNNLTDEEMRFGISQGVLQNIDSLSQLERYGKINPGAKIWVRINTDVGAGHHSHTITGGPDSKFGVYHDKVKEIKEIASRHKLKIIGVHQHIGSGILNPQDFITAMDALLPVAKQFENLESVDFGGGIGIPYRPDQKPINLEELGKIISEKFKEFCKQYGKELTLTIEPGRFLVAESGVLIAKVNTVKETPKHKFVGVDSGFNHLVRPAMYGSYHEIVKADEVKAEKNEKVLVAGNICESGDLFTLGDGGEKVDRELPVLNEGDIIGILNVGAYGFSMASTYNLRPRPMEVMVNGKLHNVIRERETFEDLLKGSL